MSRRIVVMVVALVALVVLAGPSPADTFRVKATSERTWNPAFRHISKGDRIVWKNPTSGTHTVTAYSGRWSKNTTLPAGERTSFRFRRTGSYKYRCTRPGHSAVVNGECSGMCGEIHVM